MRSGLFSLEETEETPHCSYNLRGRKLAGTDFFSEVTSDRSHGNGLKLCQRRFRLSTKPGYVPSILKSHSFTAATEFLASNTVWRFKRGVPLYYQTMMMSSMEDYQVSSVQGSMKTIQPMQNQNAVMSDGDYYQIINPKGL
ncbi:hypothetical protein HGM15179_004388 [Zosterops borbonicus]|uniref:Uncharacterized protein n=1 Tax=Zosterops borbonicus TaxID=364589 RepID=A0A8K1GP38_9PASS|nr:hypothetical protein HGM15179_004388 [Zosterops borbonicus]